MKKLLAILMAITMCFSLVVVASAKTYSGAGFDIDISIDGDWEEDYGLNYFSFESDKGSWVDIWVYTEEEFQNEGYDTVKEYFDEISEEAQNNCSKHSGKGDCNYKETKIDGYPAFIFEEIYDNDSRTLFCVCTDTHLYEIELEGFGEDDEYAALSNAISNINFNNDFTTQAPIKDDEPIEDEESTENGNTTKNETSKENSANKNENEEDKNHGNNTVIIIVAVVAGVAIVGVVVVVILRKKKIIKK